MFDERDAARWRREEEGHDGTAQGHYTEGWWLFNALGMTVDGPHEDLDVAEGAAHDFVVQHPGESVRLAYSYDNGNTQTETQPWIN